MARNGWKRIAGLGLLGLSGSLATTHYPARAYDFVRTMERTAKGGAQVSVWERVVYSLVEANNQGADCRAPRS